MRLNEAEEYELFGYPDTEIEDTAFLDEVFHTYGSNVREVLDLACGTGRHAIEMAKKGYRVTGVDLSPERLQTAAQKANVQKLEIAFFAKDMTRLDFRPVFDAAYTLFNTPILLTRNDDLVRFMEGVHRSLKIGGLLVLEIGNLWPLIRQGKLANSSKTSEEERNGVRRRRESEIVIGPHNALMHLTSHFRYWKDGVEREPRDETIASRLFSMNELDLLCRLTRFDILQVYGAMDIHSQLDPYRVEKTEETYRSYVLVLQKGPVGTPGELHLPVVLTGQPV